MSDTCKECGTDIEGLDECPDCDLFACSRCTELFTEQELNWAELCYDCEQDEEDEAVDLANSIEVETECCSGCDADLENEICECEESE